MMDASGDQSHDLLCFEEGIPDSPDFPNSDSYVEYGTHAVAAPWEIHLGLEYVFKSRDSCPPVQP